MTVSCCCLKTECVPVPQGTHSVFAYGHGYSKAGSYLCKSFVKAFFAPYKQKNILYNKLKGAVAPVYVL